MSINFKQSREINDYKPLIDTLIPDFDYVFLHTLLQWCGHATDPYAGQGKYWEVYLVYEGDFVIGVCGLYSLVPDTNKQLWLGWLGIIPERRNKGIGKEIMNFLYKNAAATGCQEIWSYVDKEGKPLPFYLREGFQVYGTVQEYLRAFDLQHIDGDDFECVDDFVIHKDI